MAVQYCNYDIKGTLAVAGSSTFDNVTLTDLYVDQYIYHNGDTDTFIRFLNNRIIQQAGSGNSKIDFHDNGQLYLYSGGSSTLILDNSQGATFAGDVTIADGLDFRLGAVMLQDSGAGRLGFNRDTSDGSIHDSGYNAFQIQVSASGSSGMLEIQEYTGAGTFVGNTYITGSGITINNFVTHNGNTTTKFGFAATDTFRVKTSGSTRLDINNSGMQLGNANARVTTIYDQDNMSSNSATALATQQSIKAYVDTSVSGAGSGTFLPLAGGTLTGGLTGTTGTFSGNVNVSGDIEIDNTSGDPFLKLKTAAQEYVLRIDQSDSEKFQIRNTTSSVTALSIDTSSNATFAGNVSLGGSTTSYLESRYNSTSQYSSRLAFNGLQLGNNGENRIIAGRTGTGSPLAFYVNNSNDGLQNTPDGILALTLANSGNATFTGQVSGITPSAAANFTTKAYVDAHVSPAGTYLPLVGGTMSGAINMGDNDIDGIDELKFSSGTKLGDAGGTSYVSLTYADSGDGGILVIDNQGQHQGYLYGDGGATSSFGLLDGTGSWAVRCLENEYVELRYDNSAKLYTTSTGISVTGNVASTTATTTANMTIGGDLTVSGGDITLTGTGRIQGIDTVSASTDAANKSYVDAQIATIPSGLNFQGNWNASTNSPTLASGTGTPGFYYNVSVAGSTNLDGETDWQVGDWAVFVEAGATDKWEKIDNTSALTGVGANNQVSLWGGTNTLEGTTALTFTGGDLYVTGDGNSSNWYSAYQDTITAFSATSGSTTVLTLTQRDGGTITTSFVNPQGTVTGTGTNDALPMWNSAGTGIEDSPFAMGNVDQSSSNTDLIIKSKIGHHGNLKTAFGFINTDQFIIQLNNVSYFNMDTSYLRITDLPVRIGNTTGIQLYSSNSANLVTLSEENGNFAISTIPNATSDTDKFLVSDSGEVKYRTGAQVLSDIGAASSASLGNYLPLAGGTMTGDIQMSEHSVKFDQSGTRSWDISAGSGNLNITSGDSGGLVFLSPGISVEDNAFIGGYANITGTVSVGGGDTSTAQMALKGQQSLLSFIRGTAGDAQFFMSSDSSRLYFTHTSAQYSTNGILKLDASDASATFAGDLYINKSVNGLSFARVTNTNTGTGANARFQAIGESSQIDMIATSAGYTGVTGWADAGIVSTDSGASTGLILNAVSGEVQIQTAQTTALTINSSQNSTFAGNLTINGPITTFNPDADSRLRILNAGTNAIAVFAEVGDTLYLGGNNTTGMTLDTSANATFFGDITVNGGDITLGGTGRIQGVDTVTDGTDAANKDYVDTAVAGSGSGTVTGVSSATTSQLTVSQSSPAPALSIVTAAVTNGGTALATGDQIYDATSARLTSYLNLAGGTMVGNTKHNDDVFSYWGNSDDLSIQHNNSGQFAQMKNYTGDLYFTNTADGKDIIFQSDDGSGGATTYLKIDSASQAVTFVKPAYLTDNVKAFFGNSSDLQIYHDSSTNANMIASVNSRQLQITQDNLFIGSQGASETFITALANGAVSLYYDNSKKFETTSEGVTVTGHIDLNSSAMIDWANGDARIIEGEVGGYSLSFEIYNGVAATERVLLLEKDKTATFSGDIALSADSSIVLDDTPTASTASGSGTIVNWSVSVSVTAGTLYVIKSDGGWTTADADSEAKSTAMAAIALGSNATSGMLLQGFFYKASHGFAIGSPLYISNTAGAFTNSRPTGTGDYVRIIGYATSTNYIYFDPDKTWVKID